MSREFFDVVNERDEVIDQQPRREVHRQGLKHRAVHLLVFNRKNQLFLQKRSLHKDCFPGKWDSSAAGHLQPGESYEAAVDREAREELGIHDLPPPEKLWKITACPETGQEFVWVFQTRHEGPFHLDPDEIETGMWISPESLDQWIATQPEAFASGFLLLWHLYSQCRHSADGSKS